MVLTNNCMIPVSKKYIKDFNKCYRDFILKGCGNMADWIFQYLFTITEAF